MVHQNALHLLFTLQKSCHLTNSELSARLGVEERTIYNWKRALGQQKPVVLSPDSLKKIQQFVEVAGNPDTLHCFNQALTTHNAQLAAKDHLSATQVQNDTSLQSLPTLFYAFHQECIQALTGQKLEVLMVLCSLGSTLLLEGAPHTQDLSGAQRGVLLNLMGLMYKHTGQFELALAQFHRALPHLSEGTYRADVVANMARVKTLQGFITEARALFQEALGNHPGSINVLYNWLCLESRANHLANCQAIIRHVLKVAGGWPEKESVSFWQDVCKDEDLAWLRESKLHYGLQRLTSPACATVA